MAESVPMDAEWQYDYIDHYRLDENIITRFLEQKWGNYRYAVKACRERWLSAESMDHRLTWRSAWAMNFGSGYLEPWTTFVGLMIRS